MTICITKKCKKCGIIKLLSEFVKDKQCIDGYAGYCLDCCHKDQQKWYIKNKEKLDEIHKEYYLKNKEKIDEYRKEYCLKNKEKIAEYKKEYRLKNKEKIAEHRKEYCLKNKEKIAEHKKEHYLINKEKYCLKNKEYRLKNKEKLVEYRKEHLPRRNKLSKLRYKNNPKWKLNRTISNSICKTLKGKKAGRHWEDLVGYTISDLKKHLQKQFITGMSWENYGDWHIDHKIPIAAHNFTDPEHVDFRKCWSLNNLQPMWAKDNIAKGARLAKPFQPSLLM